MTNPKIIYLTSAKIPGRRAHSIQTVRTCSALTGVGAPVWLLAPRRRGVVETGLRRFYGVRTPPRVLHLPCLDLLRSTAAKGAAYLILILSFFLSALPALTIIGATGPTVLYLRERRLLVLAWLTKPLHRLPIIYEMHELPSFTGFTGRIQRLALRGCEGIVVLTHYQASTLSEKLGHGCVEVIPDAADESLILRDTPDRLELRRMLGLPEDAVIAAYIGQLSRWKNPEFILEAARHVREGGVVFLLVGGSEKDVERVRREAERLGVDVILTGFVEPSMIPLYLKSSDILIHYSASRGDMASLSPLKLFEYMLAAKPILAPDYPYIREVVEDGVEAILFKPDDPGSLAEKLSKLVGNLEEAERMGVRARAKALERYTYTARARKILEMINRCL